MSKNKGEIWEWLPVILLLLFIVILFGSFIYFIMLPTNDAIDRLNDRFHYHSIEYTEKVNIVSLRDDNYAYGQFALGTGFIEGRSVYIYYVKNADGGYNQHYVYADMSTIYMDEDANPYLIKHFYETDKYHVRFEASYILHVPNETVKRGFNLE